MDAEVSYPSGVNAGDPWDHPSFISTVDTICNNWGINSHINAPSSVPSNFQSNIIPSPFIVPSSITQPVTSYAPIHKEALWVFGVSMKDECGASVGSILTLKECALENISKVTPDSFEGAAR